MNTFLVLLVAVMTAKHGLAGIGPDPGGRGYLYHRLADHLATLIRTGELVPGARLPNERRLAREHDVSIGTVRRATQLLRERGLVVTIVGRGTYVL